MGRDENGIVGKNYIIILLRHMRASALQEDKRDRGSHRKAKSTALTRSQRSKEAITARPHKYNQTPGGTKIEKTIIVACVNLKMRLGGRERTVKKLVMMAS